MPSFPYGRQVLFPISLSLVATWFLDYAVYDCNFAELTNDNVQGVSVGFWQTSDDLNGNIIDGQHNCVPWTDEQASTFDEFWNFGRRGGTFTFVLSVLSTLLLGTTTCMKLPRWCEVILASMQFLAGVYSALLLLAFASTMCTEFECWLDIGGLMCIAASGIFFLCAWITMSMGDFGEDEPGNNSDDKSVETTETGSFGGDAMP